MSVIATYWRIIGDGPHACWFGDVCRYTNIPVFRGHETGVQFGDAGVIHHVNGDHSDNDPSNLAPSHNACHAAFHASPGEVSSRLGIAHTVDVCGIISYEATQQWRERLLARSKTVDTMTSGQLMTFLRQQGYTGPWQRPWSRTTKGLREFAIAYLTEVTNQQTQRA